LKNIAEGDGDLTQRLDDNHRNEMGELAREFNRFIYNVQNIVKNVVASSENIDSQLTNLLEVNTKSSKDMDQQKSQTDRSKSNIFSICRK
jgi:methyl-accepting chemotaxis protein